MFRLLTKAFFASLVLITFPQTQALAGREEGGRYLIITHDNFYESILPLAQWKHKKGMMCKVVKLSEIGSSYYQIGQYIRGAYGNWPIPPEYVLLVGDTEYLPTCPGLRPTDNWYANMDDDYLAEIALGRVSVDTRSECETMVSKTLGYERTPHLQAEEPDWLVKATLIVRDDYDPGDSIYYGDTWYIYGLMRDWGYVQVDTLFLKDGACSSDVITAVNEGRGFVNYRGIGFVNWWLPFMIEPDSLANGWKLPIVISGTCGTGSFQDDGFVCEDWTRAGTAEEPKGAVAFFGTNTAGQGVYISSLRGAVTKGFFKAVFEDSIFTLGGACLGGKFNLYQLYDNQWEYEGWNLLGDPELNLWTSTPKTLTVGHPQAIPVGPDSMRIDVLDGSAPVSNALVCILMDTTVYEYSYTDTSGAATFFVNPASTGTLWVTATTHDYIPYEGHALVVPPTGPWVGYLSHTVDDSSGGNGDGVVNPGEEVRSVITLKNFGLDPAYGVSALLRTAGRFAQVTDSFSTFGDILPDSVSQSDQPYVFSVSPHAPDQHLIRFSLDVVDDSLNHWRHYPSVVVSGPLVAYRSSEVDDSLGGNNNHVPDPGETVDLVLSLKNRGSADADSIIALLTTGDPFVTVLADSSYFGQITSDSTANNLSNPYSFQVSDSCYECRLVKFWLDIRGARAYSSADSFDVLITPTQPAFTEVCRLASEEPWGVAWGDYDDDGDLDVAIANSGSNPQNKLYRNDGGDIFTELDCFGEGSSRGVAWGDYDNDGDLDLAVGNWNSEDKIYRNEGRGVFAEVVLSSGFNWGMSWCDYDNDGDLDLLSLNFGYAAKLYRNDGLDFVELHPFGLLPVCSACWGDYDNDGDADLALGLRTGHNKLFRNEGGDQFTEFDQFGEARTCGIAWGDYDCDGDLDLAVAKEYTAGNRLYRNEGEGIFAEVECFGIWHSSNIAWGDYDNDGDLDAVVSNYFEDNKLYRNDREDIFTELDQFGSGGSVGTAWGDYDNDGDLDLIVANRYEENIVFRNDENDSNYVEVKTVGRGIPGYSNRDGVGAKVRIYDAGTSALRGFREIRSGYGYCSMNSLDAEFGVSRGRRYDVEVSWPASGLVDWVRDVLAPAIVIVTEGSTSVEETLPSESLLPKKFALHNAFPNPLYRKTEIRYDVPVVSWITLGIYSVNGQLVRTLVNREVKAGCQGCSWDGKGADGESVASGIYFYRLLACPLRGSNSADFSTTRKLVLLR